ncbi:hypothetical protein D9M69_728150 [compost metagenome]
MRRHYCLRGFGKLHNGVGSRYIFGKVKIMDPVFMGHLRNIQVQVIGHGRCHGIKPGKGFFQESEVGHIALNYLERQLNSRLTFVKTGYFKTFGEQNAY